MSRAGKEPSTNHRFSRWERQAQIRLQLQEENLDNAVTDCWKAQKARGKEGEETGRNGLVCVNLQWKEQTQEAAGGRCSKNWSFLWSNGDWRREWGTVTI